jgi:hypothetical protein
MAHTDHHDKAGYDKSEINVKQLLIWAIVCAVFVIASIVFVVQYFSISKEETVYTKVLKPESISLRDLRAREDEILNSYKVLDPVKGVYQIPIERAMEVMADEAYRAKTSR